MTTSIANGESGSSVRTKLNNQLLSLSSQFYADATDASIRTAASAANAAGGGVVFIPAGRITLSSALPFYNGVIYQGTPWRSQIPGAATAGVGGTILVGNGTFNGMEYHPADLGAPLADTATFLAGQVNGAGARDITFENFSYGIKIGGLYNPGIAFGRFEYLYFVNCQQWGMWIENYAECCSTFLEFNNCQVGQLARVNSGTNLYNGGNSSWESAQCTKPQLARGLISWTRGTNSNTTEDYSLNEGANGPAGATYTQAATMTNGSANITVTDGTKFLLDMPFVTSADANGLFQLRAGTPRTYFVVSQSGNTIQVSDTMRGTAIVSTGSTAVNFMTKGFAMVECAGLDSTCSFICMNWAGLDVEGSATCHVVLQNITSRYNISLGNIAGGDVYNTYVRRNAKFGSIYDLNNYLADTDAASTSNVDLTAALVGTGPTFNIGNIILDGTANNAISWGGAPGAANADVFLKRLGAGLLSTSNGVNPTSLRVYNTTDSTLFTNGEFGVLGWDSSNNLFIGTDKSGTGSVRQVRFMGGGTTTAVMDNTGWNFIQSVFGNQNFYANGLASPVNGLTGTSFAGSGQPTFYSNRTSGVFLATNATGDNYGSMSINGAQLWGIGSSVTATSQSTNSMQWDGSGNAFLGSGTLATNATNGFPYVSSSAGTPTGTPTTQSGFVACEYDTTHDEIGFYNNAQWNMFPFFGVNCAPTTSSTLKTGYSEVVVRKYTIAASTKLTLATGSIMRIL